MGDTPNNPATPPAVSGAITLEAMTKALQDATQPLTTQIATLQGELKTVQEGHKALQDAQGKALTSETAGKVIIDTLAAQQAAQAGDKARQAVIADKLKGIPAIYTAQLGTDPAKFDAEAKTIRERFQADLKAAGIKAEPVSSDAGAGQGVSPGQVGDLSKLTGGQLIALGVKDSANKPQAAAKESPKEEAAKA